MFDSIYLKKHDLKYFYLVSAISTKLTTEICFSQYCFKWLLSAYEYQSNSNITKRLDLCVFF